MTIVPMTALVTGAYGFVGRHVAKALAVNDYVVTGIGHGAWARDEWRNWGIEAWHDVDVTTDALVTYANTPDVIVHCAGSGSVAYSMTHPRQDFERSVTTSVAVLEFQRLYAPLARLVVPSSAGVYGLVETLPIRTDAPLNPVSPYGVNKKIVEDIVRSYARHFGLRTAIVRLFSVYGAGQRKQLLWDACVKFARGEVAFAGTGAETRDWLHVDDAASLLVAAVESAAPDCHTMNGGTGVATTNAALLDMLARHFEGGLKPIFSGETRAGDPQHYQADMSATASLKWRPTRELSEGIAAYADWYKRGAA